jgi:allantoicase
MSAPAVVAPPGTIDLACDRIGGRAVLANDEFFAEKEHLVRAAEAEFDPNTYTERGKQMDGWETRRRRTPGHDWCIVALGAPGRLREIVVDTAHFRGNHPSHCSIDACNLNIHDGGTKGEMEQLAWGSVKWTEIVPHSPLQGHSRNNFEIDSDATYSHVRLNIHPDGGVARLRVYGEARPDWAALVESGDAIDLVSAINGGVAVTCNDMFFSDQQNLLLPRKAPNMGEGWETRRRREPGNDWVIVRLGAPAASIGTVVVDTAHFKGNYPDRCSIDVAHIEPTGDEVANCCSADVNWSQLLAEHSLDADTEHRFNVDKAFDVPPTHMRLNIFPDGGVSRLRVYGTPALSEMPA